MKKILLLLIAVLLFSLPVVSTQACVENEHWNDHGHGHGYGHGHGFGNGHGCDYGQAENVYILVHGAWHGSWNWYELEELLRKGNKVVSVNLPGHGIDDTNPGMVSLDDYVNKVVRVIDRQSVSVILVGHSMGGIVISMAAERRPEKIKTLVYLSAFLLQDGQTLLDIAGQDLNSQVLPNLIVNEAEGFIDLNRQNLADMFYNTTPKSYFILSKKLITRQPILPFATPIHITEQNFGSVKKVYISTLLDHAITPEFQEIMYTAVPCDRVYKIQTDHSSFFSAPIVVKNILDEVSELF